MPDLSLLHHKAPGVWHVEESLRVWPGLSGIPGACCDPTARKPIGNRWILLCLVTEALPPRYFSPRSSVASRALHPVPNWVVDVNYLKAPVEYCCITSRDYQLPALGACRSYVLHHYSHSWIMYKQNYSACREFIPWENKVAPKLIFRTKRATENQLIAYYSTPRQSKGNSRNGCSYTSANAVLAECFVGMWVRASNKEGKYIPAKPLTVEFTALPAELLFFLSLGWSYV